MGLSGGRQMAHIVFYKEREFHSADCKQKNVRNIVDKNPATFSATTEALSQ